MRHTPWNQLSPFWKIIVVVVAAVILLVNHRKGIQSRDWEPVPGRIEWSEVVLKGADQLTLPNNDELRKFRYQWQLRYRYQVDGKTYTGSRYHYGAMPYSRKALQEMARPYAYGNEVTVYINPRDPAESVLVRER
ncbi:MAG TPA: DUF3592 domain-containing protein [Fluviicoccus sp.]|nr:DUF3592 domain-containing protein [Fluviicoccus sp.]